MNRNEAIHSPVTPIRPEVRCPRCRTVIFDGLVIKSRVLRVLPVGTEAKCRCKDWVIVPLTYDASYR